MGGFRGGDGGFLTGGGAPPVGSIALYFRLRWFVIHGDVTDESKDTIMQEATAAPPSKREQSKTTIELR